MGATFSAANDRSGARVATVGLTRHKKKLWIVANCNGLSAHAGTGPGRLIMDRVEAGDIRVVPAWDLLNWAFPDLHQRTSDPTAPMSHSPDPGGTMVMLDHNTYYPSLRADLQSARRSILIVSPFIGKRIHELIPLIQDKVSAGVNVCLLVQRESKPKKAAREALACSGIPFRAIRGLHEKAVVIDEDVAYVGSLNTLSHTGNTSELMFRHVGSQMAQELTERFVAYVTVEPSGGLALAAGASAGAWRRFLACTSAR